MVRVLGVGIYIFVCILWGLYASRKTKRMYPEEGRIWIALIINTLICPIAIIVAMYRRCDGDSNKKD